MRNYQRLIWVPNHNTQEQILLRLCPDCGVVVGNEQAHNHWHATTLKRSPIIGSQQERT